MHINNFPYEILSNMLEETAKLNERDGVTFTFGLSQPPLPLQKTPLQKYVRGPLPPDQLRWDASAAIRQVCSLWHQWALEYVLKDVYVRKWKGSERWVNLTRWSNSCRIYELIDRPKPTAVYRDPYSSLRRTALFLAQYPEAAAKVRRMWYHGFYHYETDTLLCLALRSCPNLTTISIPSTSLRRFDAHVWSRLLSGGENGKPLESLELQAVDLKAVQARDPKNHVDLQPLNSPLVDFSHLKRLKLFGDAIFMPVNDQDLQAIARTATRLEQFHLTCLSTVSIEGVMMVVRSSQSTLRVLEHSPRSDDGFYHPHPGSSSNGEHLCQILADCPRLENLSVSLPSMCATLFSNRDVRWHSDCQVRALHLCGHEDIRAGNSAAVHDALRTLLHQARRLCSDRRRSSIPVELAIELFFAELIFDPYIKAVHGDFQLSEVLSGGAWPTTKMLSRKGPYGSTGLYGKEEEFPFDRVDEDEFLAGVSRGWVSLAA